MRSGIAGRIQEGSDRFIQGPVHASCLITAQIQGDIHESEFMEIPIDPLGDVRPDHFIKFRAVDFDPCHISVNTHAHLMKSQVEEQLFGRQTATPDRRTTAYSM